MARQNVKSVIRALLDERGEISSADVQKETGLTRQAVHHHLRNLVEAGEVKRIGHGRGTRYHTPDRVTTRFELEGLSEDRVWRDLLAADDRLVALPQNSRSIAQYALTEMVNNAIDHSRGAVVVVGRRWTDGSVAFDVTDDGVGAFRTVRTKLGLPDDFAAIQQISKGKTTTEPEKHTGEGIFFTSKAVDRFVLEANGLRWIVDSERGDQAVGESELPRGTRVRWHLDSDTDRTLGEVFSAYTDPDTYEFSRSRVTVKLAESGDAFISRSEAKRLAHGLEKFEDVLVDFIGVREVGQGFVDELFRVWARQHPDTQLVPVNMSPAVEAMVKRGLPSER